MIYNVDFFVLRRVNGDQRYTEDEPNLLFHFHYS